MMISEGGPGSGVAYRNTAPINLPKSDYISVGTRKGLQANMDYDEYDVPLKHITKVGQTAYVPEKVNKFLKNRDWIRTKPIDVLWVRGDGYHMIDGHHRYMAASAMNMETLPARVFKKAEKTMPDYVADNPEKKDEIDVVTRTTADASNPGFKLYQAAEAMEQADWDMAISLLSESETYVAKLGQKRYTFNKEASIKVLDLLKKLKVSREDAAPSFVEKLAKKHQIKLDKYQALDIASRYIYPSTQKALKESRSLEVDSSDLILSIADHLDIEPSELPMDLYSKASQFSKLRFKNKAELKDAAQKAFGRHNLKGLFIPITGVSQATKGHGVRGSDMIGGLATLAIGPSRKKMVGIKI